MFDIKFRIRFKRTGKTEEVDTMDWENGELVYIGIGDFEKGDYWHGVFDTDNESIELQMYTGKKDKRGRLIYKPLKYVGLKKQEKRKAQTVKKRVVK